ncbi:MAG: DUF5677 domain-containing protein [Elusimicrobiales bacterium]
MQSNSFRKNETPLSKHERNKKVLTPPLLKIPKLKINSWRNDRLPEMLWAVLVIGNIQRTDALEFFRYIAKFVDKHPDCFDVSITGIAQLPSDKRRLFIKHFTSYSSVINDILRPMLLFPQLPGFADWKKVLPEPIPDKDWKQLGMGVALASAHQTQEATDCRWIRFLCMVFGGKMRFHKDMAGRVEELLKYPNLGDMTSVRPFIRSTEATLEANSHNTFIWAPYFWDYCFEHTQHGKDVDLFKKIEDRKKHLFTDYEHTKNNYFEENELLRRKLFEHFLKTKKSSVLDARHDAAFGLSLYALSMFSEIVCYGANSGILGRLGLRALVEVYITFAYLLKNEKDKPDIWGVYRAHGYGQAKLVHLTAKELKTTMNSIELDVMEYIAGEDFFGEFVPINLGHWDSGDLRQMAEEAGLKDVYRKYYAYTSGFIHGNWAAVRESQYQTCMNPTHRLHCIPHGELSFLPSVTNDAVEIVNSVFACLSLAYPDISVRIKTYDQHI